MSDPHYYLVNLRLGRSNKGWQKYWEVVHINMGGADLDYSGHAKTKIVKSFQSYADFKYRLTSEIGGAVPESDLSVEEITRETVKNDHIGLLEVIQRYFKDFDDV